MELREFCRIMEEIAPRDLALEFDNVGLLVEPDHSEIKKVLLALDCTSKTAREAVELATVNGAKALGRPDTGVLAPGKLADVIALDLDRPHLSPCHDPMEHLVYSARSSDVVLTMARGKILYRNGFFSTIDVDRMKYNLGQALPLLFGK